MKLFLNLRRGLAIVMMEIKQILKKIPVVYPLYILLRKASLKRKLNRLSVEEVFVNMYWFRKKTWPDEDSVSGSGSTYFQTRNIVKGLPKLFSELGATSILDIPCGDFCWMSKVDLLGINYIGADIVDELIVGNKEVYHRDNILFTKLNLLTDEFPKVDLIFCRDCMTFFSYKDIFKVLENISRSDAKYFVTTTFIGDRENQDSPTGLWQAISLEGEPFNLPKPMKVINEVCTECDGLYSDKSLGVWKVDDIRKTLEG